MKRVVIISTLLSISVAYALDINTSDIVKDIKKPKEVEEKLQKPKIEIKEEILPPIEVDDNSSTYIKDFEIKGNSVIQTEVLKELLSKYKNKTMSFKEIKESISLLTKEYRKNGYFVARAYIPMQDIDKQDGILKVAIIEGSYGNIIINNKSLVNDKVVSGILNKTKDKRIINSSDIQQSLMVLNNTAGAVVSKIDVQPGKAVGSSDMSIDVDRSKRVNSFVIADNYGSKYSGKNRVMVGADINSPTTYGDKLSLIGMATKSTNIKYYQFGYEIPIMSNGLSVGINYNKTSYALVDLGGTNIDKAYTGDVKSKAISLSYPLKNSKNENIKLKATMEFKDVKDYYFATQQNSKKINLATASIEYQKNYTFSTINGSTNTQLTYSKGNLNIKDTTAKSNDLSGANTSGNFSKLNLEISNSLQKSIYTFDTTLKIQHSLKNKNLDGSEDMSLGGSSGIKVFPSGELSAENGIMLNSEFKIFVGNYKDLSNTLGLFYDVGSVDMADSSNVTTFQRRTLQDIGLGYYANYQGMFSKLQYAHTLGGAKSQTEDKENSKILVQLGYVF